MRPRRYVRRRTTYRRRNNSNNQRYTRQQRNTPKRPTIMRFKGNLMPQVAYVKFKNRMDLGFIRVASERVLYGVFAPNRLNQPFQMVGSADVRLPTGFEQWAAFYDFVTVLGAQIEIESLGLDYPTLPANARAQYNNVPFYIAALPDQGIDYITSPPDLDVISECPIMKKGYVTVTAEDSVRQPERYKLYATTSKVCGVPPSAVITEFDYTHRMDKVDVPVSQWFFIVVIGPLPPGTNLTAVWSNVVTITQYCRLWSPNQLPPPATLTEDDINLATAEANDEVAAHIRRSDLYFNTNIVPLGDPIEPPPLALLASVADEQRKDADPIYDEKTDSEKEDEERLRPIEGDDLAEPMPVEENKGKDPEPEHPVPTIKKTGLVKKRPLKLTDAQRILALRKIKKMK